MTGEPDAVDAQRSQSVKTESVATQSLTQDTAVTFAAGCAPAAVAGPVADGAAGVTGTEGPLWVLLEHNSGVST
jgi:hypothetical protein